MWLLGTTLAITVIGVAVLRLADPGRMSGKQPGIVAFELAGTASKATEIAHGWGEFGRTVAAFNLGFDYLFILGYSTLLALLCLWAGPRYASPRLAAAAALFAWLQWVAGLLDCTENAALLVILFRGASDRVAAIARMSSLGKFGLLACGVVYILSSLL
jgi:hypothetical protein